jgi:capsular polysaccharide biosynthesis protein
VTDDNLRLASVGRLVRRRWRPLLGVAVVGAVLGFGLSFLLSPGYQAASKVLIQGQSVKLALVTETQIATSLAVLDATSKELGWGVSGIGLQGSVSANVLDGSVIEIVGTAPTRDRARALTDSVTAHYVAFSAKIANDTTAAAAAAQTQRRQAFQKPVDDLTAQVRALEANPRRSPAEDVTLDDLRRSLQTATTALATYDTEQTKSSSTGTQTAGTQTGTQTTATTVLEPAIDRGAATPTPVELTIAGAVVCVLVCVLLFIRAERTDDRLRTPDDVAAALGAPVVATFGVEPDDETAQPASSRNWLGNLLRTEAAWDPIAPPLEDERDEARYRRVLAQLRAGPTDELRAVVALIYDDDAAGVLAVARFAAAVATEERPVVAVTNRAEAARLIRRQAGHGGPRRLPVSVIGTREPVPSSARLVLHVVDLAAAHPVIPDYAPAKVAFLALGVGLRTPAELIAVDGACTDAGLSLRGAVLAELREREPAAAGGPGSSAPTATPTSDNGSTLTGSA